VHEHCPETFEDIGDAENGPQLTGGPAFDRYAGDSHEIIMDYTGLIVHMGAIDWDEYRFFNTPEMLAANASWPGDDDAPRYVRPRKAGEDHRVTFTDEDGPWYACHGPGWTDDIKEAAWMGRTQAEQTAHAFNSVRNRDDRMTGSAYII
jgi:hypothetical protein